MLRSTRVFCAPLLLAGVAFCLSMRCQRQRTKTSGRWSQALADGKVRRQGRGDQGARRHRRSGRRPASSKRWARAISISANPTTSWSSPRKKKRELTSSMRSPARSWRRQSRAARKDQSQQSPAPPDRWALLGSSLLMSADAACACALRARCSIGANVEQLEAVRRRRLRRSEQRPTCRDRGHLGCRRHRSRDGAEVRAKARSARRNSIAVETPARRRRPRMPWPALARRRSTRKMPDAR